MILLAIHLRFFSKSITQYKEEFDINYKAPSFQEVMYKNQVNLESFLGSSHLLKYENFRKQDYSFDRYVVLNSTKYSSLNVNTKYNHIVAASLSDGISGLTLILQNAGLGAVSIEAIVGAVTTLTSAVSTSWIPVIGGGLAIALAAGALIGLTVIIVQNWDNIKS